ncbi:phosphopantetheine-binding protein [Dactylosporangium matsuzakiense]|nr:phosphopantetheine-binding protein [Dactylosporangium matsuzakiense]
MTATWNDSFVQALREQLPELPGEDVLTPATDLYELGLDSLRSVQLLLALEDAWDISIPDDMLTADTFRTPGSIWTLVQTVDAQQHQASRDS